MLAGLAGIAIVAAACSTTGASSEPSSFKILNATHEAFVQPAQEAILKGVFKPAKFRGRPVRQLVQVAEEIRDAQRRSMDHLAAIHDTLEKIEHEARVEREVKDRLAAELLRKR